MIIYFQDSTFVDVECRVENWKGFVDITKFYVSIFFKFIPQKMNFAS